MMRNGPVTKGWAKDEPNPKIGFCCVLFISESGSANLFANSCNMEIWHHCHATFLWDDTQASQIHFLCTWLTVTAGQETCLPLMQVLLHCWELDSRERFATAKDQDLILILSMLLFLHDWQLLAMYFQLQILHNSSYKQKNDYQRI